MCIVLLKHIDFSVVETMWDKDDVSTMEVISRVIGRSICKNNIVDKIWNVTVLEETLIVVLVIQNVLMLVRTNKNQEVVYLDWVAQSLDHYSSHLGIRTSLNDVLMIVVD